MKYSTHGSLTLDQWRSNVFGAINTDEIIRRSVRTSVKEITRRKESKIIPTIAGFAAVGTVYTAAAVLAVADGPLPFGDAIAVGLLAIPDAAIFAFGYELFD